MSATKLSAALRRLAPDDTPDGELLSRYVTIQDEAAFAELVRRHGGMVRNVCKRVLRNDADADDAVQATFLVFVRKAVSIRDRNGLANWLFGVAHNVALKARQMRTRRQAKEADVPPRPPEAVASDFAELLHAELAKLPAASRAVIVLCDLEGRTLADAAKHLDIPVGTVASRLARGRDQLANRLAKHGLSVSAGLLATLFGESAKAAVVFDTAACMERIHTLASEVIRTMFTTPKLTKLMAVLLGVFVLGGGVVMLRGEAKEPAPRVIRKNAPVPKEKRPTAKELLAAAEEEVAAIQDLPTRADYQSYIAGEYALCGETEKANKGFAAAVLHYKAAKIIVFESIPWHMTEVGMAKDGLVMLDDLCKSDPARGPSMRSGVCIMLALVGDLKRMDEVRELVPNGGGEYMAFLAARAYLAAGEFEKAEKAFKEVAEPLTRIRLRSELVAVYHRAGKKEAAEKALKATVELADAASAEEKDADKQAGFAVLVGRAKVAVAPADRRAEAHKELLATVAGIKSAKRAGEELLAVVDADLLAGDLKAATAAAEACVNQGWKDKANLRIVDFHLAKGDAEKAAKKVGELKRPFWEGIARARLAEALGKSGKTDEAKKQIAAAEKLVGPFGDGFRPGHFEDGPPEGSIMALGGDMARAWVAAGEVESQKAAAEKLAEPYQRVYRLLTLAKGFRPPSREERRW